jgi:predicted flavoprotein YhiN
MNRNHSNEHRHAVVIRGSIAGLLAARVLSEHYDRVTLVERDARVVGKWPNVLPALFSGAGQGRSGVRARSSKFALAALCRRFRRHSAGETVAASVFARVVPRAVAWERSAMLDVFVTRRGNA